ncbi:MAG: hypothetical protein FWE04_08330 [Oscillospiraceae bacterium]|nr:hypothetical protein [Oscillospiraceae bacterium]
MASRIVKSLIDEKVENFKLAFQKTSFGLFYDEKKQELIHPGEKGTYCESIAKDFLRPFIPQRLDIGTGFIINAYDEVSTQCDIVIYDAKNTPLIENDQKQRFFPVETVVAVGEIKSGKKAISRTELKEIVNKLAKIKKMNKLKGISNSENDHSHKFDKKDPRDSLATFLICNDITRKEKIASEMSDLYEKDYIRDDYLSFALFIEGGVLSHSHDDGKGDKGIAPYPVIKNCSSEWCFKEKLHFHETCHYLWQTTSLAYIYTPDIISYLRD